MYTIKEDFLTPIGNYSFSETTGENWVWHTTLGSNYQGAEDTLKLRHLSYHFIIEFDGTINQLVPITRGAWGAGVVKNMNMRARAAFGWNNPNKLAINAAFVRNGEARITNAQRDAAVWLMKYVGKKLEKRYVRDNTFAHVEITKYDQFSKPPEVLNYMEQVMQSLEGFKDMKDAGQSAKAELLRKVLIEIVKRYYAKNK